MERIEQRGVVKSKLDLRKWWVMVKSFDEAKEKISSWEAKSCYWYDESGNFINTLRDLKGGQMLYFAAEKTKVLLPSDSKEWWEKAWKWNLKENIFTALKKYRIYVDVKTRVENPDEAYSKASAGEKKRFWLIDNDAGIVKTLDFSEWNEPVVVEYPLKDTDIKYYTTELQL